MPCVGTLIYSAFVWSLTGNPFAWVAGHAAWGRQYTGLTSLVTDRYTYIANAGVYGYVSQLPLDLLNAMGVIFVLATAWPVARRFGMAVRRVPADQHPGPDCGWRTAVGGAVFVGALSGISLDGERRAAKPPVRLDRHVRGESGLQRVAVLHLAAVVLIGRRSVASTEPSSICDGLRRLR